MLSRRVLACERRLWSVALGVLSVLADSLGAVDFSVCGSAGSELGSESGVEVFLAFARILRPARRSLASLGAPVAKRTRSGSTWNMSPGFS